ncbi:TonB-dependent receptor [Sphingomonas sp. Leaf357]|uniref:TonB-dependent hemoglobin/transferrin/lactoferrin family receptor n=1 Tax=Sphingomonas sp. Leaf357 TaxID=1736350 RepID=UPI0006FC6682|nr:TonB-dependent hemoglobin/transferrin/lactoferrin family receptor [Sphingomonas sp. Leaf357]KQS03856.1 TonB-dependent receptor [Sphingomonas sp. Leaf357]
MKLAGLLLGISPVAFVVAAVAPASASSADPVVFEATTGTDVASAPDVEDQNGVITVTATRTEKPVEDVPATVSVIDTTTIDDRLISDIKDLVRYEPGVSVRRAPARFTAAGASTGRDRDSGFNIRGLEGNRVLITVDGVRVPDAFAFGAQSVGRGDYVDLDLLKSVEILRGPASALYGSDGVAGAVSFITKDPQDFLKDGKLVGGGLRVGYDGADNSWTKGLVVAGKAGDIQAIVAFTRRDGHGIETKGTNDSANTDRTTAIPQDIVSNALLARLVWTPTDGSRVRLTYERFASVVDSDVLSAITKPLPPAPLASTAVLGLRALDTTSRDRGTIDYRYIGDGAISGIRAAAYYQQSKTDQTGWEDRNTALDRIRINRFDNEVYGGMLQLESRLATGLFSHLFAYGADYSHTRQTGVRDGTVPPAGETYPTRAFPTTDYTLVGVFAQDEIGIADGLLTLFPSIRYDHYKLSPQTDPLFTTFVPRGQSASRFTPRLGAVAKLTGNIRLFANYSQGFKPPEPNQINNGFANLVSNYRSIPNPDLKPETSNSIEGGVRLNGQRWSLSGTAFRSRFRDFIDQVQVSGAFTAASPAVFQYINRGRVKIEGLEARGEARLPIGLGVRAAASYAKGRVESPNATTGVVETLPLDSVDPVKFVAGIFYQPEDGPVRAELAATHAAGKKLSDTNNSCNVPARAATSTTPAVPATYCFTPPGFWIFDATVSLKVRDHATVRAGVFNITDKKYFWWSDVRGLSATSVVQDAYSQPGRNAGVSVSFSL